jgi:lysyl-tRNA synthetase class 2
VSPPDRRTAARARARLAAETRRLLGALGYQEVETPVLVPAPGMEPHLSPFETAFVGEGGGPPRRRWLITSPEYAMKRLLAEGFERIFQLSRVFRNGEVSATHNPEFTMLEFYRAGTDYRGIMADLEQLVAGAAAAFTGGTSPVVERDGGRLSLAAPFERLTVQQAFQRHAGVDLGRCGADGAALRSAARAAGHDAGPDGEPFDDAFFRLMLGVVEPRLGRERPTFLTDWPASMAALARLKQDDPRWAERFELYAGGLELANGFSELTDAAEQRRRLVEEQALRRRLGRPALPLDEPFLEALPGMPAAGGVAVGFDRLLMLLTGAATIREVLLFPAEGFREA